MEVIFTKSVSGVAARGDAKNVKRGYFRNYLLPRGLAILAIPSLVSKYAKIREHEMLKKEEINNKALEVLERLSGKVFTLSAKVTKKGTLYRGISVAQIVSAVKAGAQIEIDPSNIVIEKPIKTVGKHEVTLKLTPDVSANISLEVSPS